MKRRACLQYKRKGSIFEQSVHTRAGFETIVATRLIFFSSDYLSFHLFCLCGIGSFCLRTLFRAVLYVNQFFTSCSVIVYCLSRNPVQSILMVQSSFSQRCRFLVHPVFSSDLASNLVSFRFLFAIFSYCCTVFSVYFMFLLILYLLFRF